MLQVLVGCSKPILRKSIFQTQQCLLDSACMVLVEFGRFTNSFWLEPNNVNEKQYLQLLDQKRSRDSLCDFCIVI